MAAISCGYPYATTSTADIMFDINQANATILHFPRPKKKKTKVRDLRLLDPEHVEEVNKECAKASKETIKVMKKNISSQISRPELLLATYNKPTGESRVQINKNKRKAWLKSLYRSL